MASIGSHKILKTTLKITSANEITPSTWFQSKPKQTKSKDQMS
jgi:hypothetical protein